MVKGKMKRWRVEIQTDLDVDANTEAEAIQKVENMLDELPTMLGPVSADAYELGDK